MSKAKNRTTIPDNINEEYYQIGLAIIESFPKYRPPVDLFVFKEELGVLEPLFRKGSRLSNEEVELVNKLCSEGDLFVSRTDHPIYSQHIVKQLDLVLVDKNLKEGEVADIIQRALALRLNDFLEQPVKILFDPLYVDLMVLTEYLNEDNHRIKLFMRRLSTEYSLVNHSTNTLWVGLWLLFNVKTSEELTRKSIDNTALALLLHDIGMSKVPPFILTKSTALKIEEKDKILPHPVVGFKIAQKLELVADEVRQAIVEHHERLDGSGYPQKAKANQLSRLGRIAAVADSFCAMITKRPYAGAKAPLAAAQELMADKARYDSAFASALAGAYVMEAFGKNKA
ncbi:HD domain-containing protein [Desulfovibrio litoralis DSM 11393]|uniref:HD domain-containing protein n=1 Tax=Desulfovibrio litoralis DSM 11393 TaxID=1121455 RepID=A0A1M7TEQ0_9BACT|nr:HD domain-containing protein [Desulfovibrio litoralis DSM 11393]